jgi:hypothetical protein
MYSESDIDAAVAAGALSADAASALREFVARTRATPAADEEQFRLLTGFNDIFVSIAIVLLLAAVNRLAGSAGSGAGAAAVAVLSWGLAEFFTRRRRMALPSIVLLLTFAGGIAGAVFLIFRPHLAITTHAIAGLAATTGAITAGAAYLHWRRFKVPITVAIGVVAGGCTVVALALDAAPSLARHVTPMIFLIGIAVFALALRWDASDRARTTRRSDVAFWLHLAAAPMLVHPLFALLGVTRATGSTTASAAIAIGIYLVLTLVALLIDRRALLVSALFYVLYAMVTVFQLVGGIDSGLALAGLAIGGLLVLLSAFWHPARRLLMPLVPTRIAASLPAV